MGLHSKGQGLFSDSISLKKSHIRSKTFCKLYMKEGRIKHEKRGSLCRKNTLASPADWQMLQKLWANIK